VLRLVGGVADRYEEARRTGLSHETGKGCIYVNRFENATLLVADIRAFYRDLR
jgi:hypothetical protein